ncbi:MAG TPA: DUF3147 family protein [Streptosporangiaceae bacterium]|jgi:hypothetical protein|nr:DUF3147 family protein [Streptosporangiaceae bacterium]
MPTPVLICLKAVNGGLFVALFAVLGEILEPKRFAGIFGAAPSIALANLLMTVLGKGETAARDASTGMIAGAVAMVVACAAAIPAVRRWGAVRGSLLLWGVWLVAGAAGALVATGGAHLMSGTGMPAGREASHGRPGKGAAKDDSGGRLFAADLGALRETRLRDLAVRFAFGAAISIVAGLVGVLAGQRAGGVLLASPAILPATLTMIEREENHRAAVTETQGSVPGAVALVVFAAVSATTIKLVPVGAALLSALAAWIAVAIAGYLTLAAAHASWKQDVDDIARQRREAAQARRGQANQARTA